MARMTREERDTKRYIANKLAAQGYPTYADIFSEFDLHLTSNPRVIGYMVPNEGYITINRNIDEDVFSVIIRHEILHFYLEHEKRLLNHLAKKHNITDIDLSDMSIEDLKNELYKDKTFNIAADYEISNRAYTEEDKDTIRTLHALVTEDDHPGWEDFTVEEMYDKLIELKQKDRENALDDIEENTQEPSDDNTNDDSDSADDSDRTGDDNSSDGGESTTDSGDSEGDQDSFEGDDEGDGGEGDDGDDGSPVPNRPTKSKKNKNQNGDKEDNSDEGDSGTPGSVDPSNNGRNNKPGNSGNTDRDNKEDIENSNGGEDSDEKAGNEEDGDKEADNKGDGDKEADNEEDDDSPKFVYGSFIDKHTFLDANGNPVSIKG